jgi:hypothetical protein
MTTRILLLFTLLFTARAALAANWQESGVIFSGKNANALLTQCSRAAPEKVTAQWTPTSAQISILEALLPAFKRTLKQPDAPLEMFYRQYAGFIAGGRKIIYVNFFPKETDPQWRSQAVVVCDGGDRFWGVEFEVVRSRFVKAAFNGVV